MLVAQIAPGPNILIVSLLGWQIAGLTGLLVATFAINLPHCILAFWVGRATARLSEKPWARAVKDALIPVTTGLILASGVVMAQAADRGLLAVVISMMTTTFIVFTRRNPIWALGAGTLASLLGAHFGM